MSNSKVQEKDLGFFEGENSDINENKKDVALKIYDPTDSEKIKKNFIKSLSYKRFDDPDNLGSEVDELITNQNSFDANVDNPPKKIKLPKFLTNPFSQKPSNLEEKEDYDKEETDDDPENINSIASVFSRDHEEVDGLRRVFKKSLSFLLIHLTLFLGLSLSGLFFFSLNPFLTLIIAVLYLVFTNIFYIIVADKSYVFLAILTQAILLVFSNSLFGLGFNPITLIITFIVVLFNYLAYSELEKIQLSSRLFSISHITGESTRILLTAMMLIISLGVFNSIISEGSSNFIERVLLSNDFIMDNFVIDGRSTFSTNRYLMGGQFTINASNNVRYFDRLNNGFRNATFRDFLKENYRSSDVLTPAEQDSIRGSCETGFNSPECDQRIRNREDELLKAWNEEAYSSLATKRGLNLEFEDELTGNDLRVLTKQLYQNQINQFEAVDGENDLIPDWLLLVPLSSVIPAFFAIGIFFLLSVSKFIFAWTASFISLVVWTILKWTGVVQIDIETVESEIVTI